MPTFAWLADQLARREFAAPFPGDREPEHRRTSTRPTRTAGPRSPSAEFAECGGGGADTIKLLTAVPRVVEEIWHDNPATTWEKAKKLLADGYSRHEVLHPAGGLRLRRPSARPLAGHCAAGESSRDRSI